MESKCYAKKKNGDLCNVNLTEKNRNKIKIEDKTFFVCGRHKNIESIDNIDISKYENTNNKNVDNYKEILSEFNEKININDSAKEVKNEKEKEIRQNNKIDIKKPCLQHILYLISKDNNDVCQYDDECQFAHNINIVYT